MTLEKVLIEAFTKTINSVGLENFKKCSFFGSNLKKHNKQDVKREMMRMSSWNGDGKDVYCVMCGDELSEKTIYGMDEDGNAYCGAHTANN
jgi:hypothetical protein